MHAGIEHQQVSYKYRLVGTSYYSHAHISNNICSIFLCPSFSNLKSTQQHYGMVILYPFLTRSRRGLRPRYADGHSHGEQDAEHQVDGEVHHRARQGGYLDPPV